MSDFVHPAALPHLSPAESRLSAVLARPRVIAAACVVIFTAAGWAALGLMNAWSWQALCQANAADAVRTLGLALPMWTAMALAMMLPSAGPMILTYAEIADTAARQREPVVSPFVLTAGYVTVWLGFAMVAAILQTALARLALFDAGSAGLAVGGMIVMSAGGYQFSALKQSCLTQCQRPFPFFFAHWTTEARGVFKLGLQQGLYCLGCCWAMMLLMLAVGAMNVVWMALLGALMTVEKLPSTPLVRKALGVAFLAAGGGMIVASAFIGG